MRRRRRERARFACSREKTGIVTCPGSCACIDIPGDPEPYRFLCDGPLLAADASNVQRLSWHTTVDFCARNLPLTTLAAYFERAFPDQLCVPAAKVRATVSCLLDAVTLAEVAESSGLLPIPRR